MKNWLLSRNTGLKCALSRVRVIAGFTKLAQTGNACVPGVPSPLLRTLCIALLFTAVLESGASDFRYQMRVSFPQYSGRTQVLTNFPALLVFSNNAGNSGFLYRKTATTNGYDLRFRDGGDTMDLNYEIQSWNTAGTSYVWVQIPRIAPDGSSAILARWGLPTQTNQLPCTTNGATWGQEYLAVWHLGGPSNQLAMDSTSNGYHGVVSNVTFASGPTGGGGNFNGSDSCLIMPAVNCGTGHVISAWFKTEDTVGQAFLGGPSDNSQGIGFSGTGGGDSFLYSAVSSLGFGHGGITTGAWHLASLERAHIVANLDYVLIYADGAVIGSTAAAIASNQLTVNRVGAAQVGTRWFKGGLAEIRIERMINRSSDWNWASWATVASNSSFAVYGAVQHCGTVFRVH